ncbi:hypothetical protein L596_003452 [Steinernema carpocapsae]|uniref:EGF-like domain-containing protein n=1 Tax=Steinernema carpocapsae TaxID=34508 RepID=A0A4U8USF7_STECR|nr:hypothetical protein L596_003452 [Steinernema carpocapsae]
MTASLPLLLSFAIIIPLSNSYGLRHLCLGPSDNMSSKTCECERDWNAEVCRENREEPLETVCICRTTFSDRQCNQFIAKCYRNEAISNGCSCCFQQSRQFCNQLSCSNMRPDLGNSSVSCSCHDNLLSVKQGLCMSAITSTLSEPFSYVIFQVFGLAFTYAHLVIMICGVFLTVLFITCFYLCLTRHQIDKQRARKFERREKARKSLLIRKQDEDNYLP